eukprot:CAMPEP_0171368132 /NCGR_PEP_ID=MMETSP0879-20121228/6537_1 /TAXON_ID=67004 /ORGANISM="Thalassiosira weissflogii, Strain CCMP1336" /LENGTH=236 /DNA_ID=CAMNT_0011876281 /DNA_START=705 /DNA_END=1411 /DNA_ORIENTATION=-
MSLSTHLVLMVLFSLLAVPRNWLSMSQSFSSYFIFFVVVVAAESSSSPSRRFYRIETGGSIPTPLWTDFNSSSSFSEELFQRIQTHHRTPPHTRHPSYHPPAGFGGPPRRAGSDGLVVLSVSSPPEDETVPELSLPEIPFFRLEGPPAEQTYRIPGNSRASPRHRLVTVRAWGAGGGGCSAGTEAADGEDDDDDDDASDDVRSFGAGRAGSYAEASFRLLAGDVLTVVVGGGGGAG